MPEDEKRADVVLLPETVPPAARQTQWEAVSGLVIVVTLGDKDRAWLWRDSCSLLAWGLSL